MSDFYTDADVAAGAEAILHKGWPLGSSPTLMGSARAVLADRAPAIAARALREFAQTLLDQAADSEDACPDGCGTCTRGTLAQLAILRADEIEGKS